MIDDFEKNLMYFVKYCLETDDIEGGFKNLIYRSSMELSLIEIATIEFYSYMITHNKEIVIRFLSEDKHAERVLNKLFECWRCAKETEWKREELFDSKDMILLPIPREILENAIKEVKHLNSDVNIINEMADHLRKKFNIDKDLVEYYVKKYWEKTRDKWH